MDSFERSGLKRRTVLSAAAMAGVVGMSGIGMRPVYAAAPSTAASAATRMPRTIRLVTGDRVVLRGERIADIEAGAPSNSPPFLRYVVDGDEYVVPGGLLGRIRAGELDERLFNVTGLAREGFEDAATADPARVSPRPSRARASAAETHRVSVRLWDRDGNHPPANDENGWNRAFFLNADTGDVLDLALAHGEKATLPPGRYLVVAAILTPQPGADYPSRSMIAFPGLTLTSDTELELDARIGNRVSVSVPDKPAVDVFGLVIAAQRIRDPEYGDYFTVDFLFPLNRYEDAYVGSVAGASDPDFIYIRRHMRQEPELQVTVTAPERFELKADWYDPYSPKLVGTYPLAAVHAGAATPDDLAGLDLAGKLVLLDFPPQDENEFQQRLGQLRAAGAVAALHVGETPPFRFDPPLPLPVGFALGVGARRLAALKVGTTVNVDLRGLRVSPYRYDLSFPARETIPTQQHHTLRRDDLAHLRVTYASHGAPALGFTGAGAFFYGFGIGAGGGAPVQRPTIRDEYVTPGEWELNSVGQFGGEQSWQARQTYQAGHHYVIDWHKAVLGPAFSAGGTDGHFQVARTGDTITSALLMFTDAQQNPGELWYPVTTEDLTTAGSQDLYRNGALLGRVDDREIAVFSVQPDAGRYELRAEIVRRAAWWRTAADISVAWTFESGSVKETTLLPLLTVQAVADVDETNTADGGRTLLLPLYVRRQDLTGPVPVRTIAVHHSLNDGKTWRPATVIPSGPARWTARIAKPGEGFLSLRFSVGDRDGNTVTQTVIRAVALAR